MTAVTQVTPIGCCGGSYGQAGTWTRRPCGSGGGGATRLTPEAYLDDRRIFLLDLVLTPNSKLCRVEYYEPPPVWFDLPSYTKFTMAPFQLRAYTCQFMAQVAAGTRTMRRNLNWGDLIAGPGG